MKHLIDLSNWKRKAHFDFFKNFEDPFWGLTTNVECEEAYKNCKDQGISFFLYYLHKSLLAANEVSEFRQRIENGRVFQYDVVHASPTISREDGTFGFSYINYILDFDEFYRLAKMDIEKVKKESGLKPAVSNENVIHYSTVPWISFSGVEYPRNKPSLDSIPKITFGKILKQYGKMHLPVSFLVNHALIDAYHIGLFLQSFQSNMN